MSHGFSRPRPLLSLICLSALILAACDSSETSPPFLPGVGSGGLTSGTGGTDTMATGGGPAAGGTATATGGMASTCNDPAGCNGVTGGVMGGSPGTGGDGSVAGMDGPGAGGSEAPPVGGDMDVPAPPYTNPGFMDLSPPLGAPLDMQGTSLNPPPPAGWVWYEIEGAICRDGSPTGFFVHYGSTDKLVIYLEGGGACSNNYFCAFNPSNAQQVLSGDGQTVLGSALGAVAGRQQPGAYTGGAPQGIFDTGQAANPYKDWHQIYVPYCTGDVHFGTRRDSPIPNLGPQQFVGYLNMQKFVGRIVPTFRDQVNGVVMTGSSAGGFGAGLNMSMVQDAFGDSAYVTAVIDSGPPFEDAYMPVCMQRRWRDAWGFADSLPPDCTECRQEDGGGLVRISDFMLRKHPHGRIAMISSMEDEVIRLFYSVGLVDCANYETADPVAITLLQGDPTVYFPAQQYRGGLETLRETYEPTGRFASYYMAGANVTFHQHQFRQRFYEAPAGGVTIAQFVADFLTGTITHVGP